jgi:hypothetical protein
VSSLVSMPSGSKLDRLILRRVGDTVEMSVVGLSSRRPLNKLLGKVPVGFRPTQDQSVVTCDDRFTQVRLDVRGGSGSVVASQAKTAEALAETSTSLVWLTDDEWPRSLPGREWRAR